MAGLFSFDTSRGETPQDAARRRQLAEAIMGRRFAPQNVGQGFMAMAEGYMGRRAERQADAIEARGRESADGARQQLIGALTGQGVPAGGGGARPASMPSGDSASAIRAGLVQRGLPEHVADAFLLNFQDESGLRTDINEHSPIVPGSRGGFGLAQWTGPRRRALEAFAQQRGTPASDMDTQLDFLMTELQGSEAQAAQAILGAQDTPTAAAAILNQFLRPAEEHRRRREASYMQAPAGPDMSARADAGPMMGATQAMTDAGGAPMGVPGQMPQGAPMAGQPQQGMPQPQMAQQQPQGMAGALPMGDLINLMSNPWLDEGTRGVIGAMIQQQMTPPAAPEQFTLSPGQQRFDAMGRPIAGVDAQPDQTSAMQNFQFLISQGVDPQTAMDRAFSGGVNVNVGGDGAPGLGRLSPDYGYVLDPDTGQPIIDRETGLPQAAAVPGSPAWQERRDAETAAEAGRRNATDYARTVTQDIGIAEDFLSQLGPISSMDGVVGANLRAARANVRGTPEWNMRGFVESALSNLTLDTMNRMRETSAAGATGMGNMSNQQLRVIQGVLGQWDPGLPIEEQQFILHRLGNFYMDVQVGTREERAQAVRDGRMTAEENQAIEAMYYPETRDVRGRRTDGATPTPQQPEAPQAPAQAEPFDARSPQPGQVLDGYMFRGGDPGNPQSWERIR